MAVGDYYSLSAYFREEFGGKVRKISVDAGFSCPNRDGTAGTGGCIFCDNAAFSPARRQGLGSITRQIDEGIERISARYGESRYLAYFQPSTNTYASVDQLKRLYEEALSHEKIAGIAIGTRPDCLSEETLDLLAEIAAKTWLSLEIGLQSSHDATLKWMNRGHNYACFADAVKRAKRRNLRIGTHVILGLPGETPEMMIETAQKIAALGIHSVKLHNLYVVRETPLAVLWEKGEFLLPAIDEYAERVVDFLEYLPPKMVIERLAGDAPRSYLLAPEWSAVKNAASDAVRLAMLRRQTYQGRLYHLPKRII